MRSPRSQLRSIQFLRFFAASAVVFVHAQSISADHFWPNNPALAYYFGFGILGVHMFFIISGFVMVMMTSSGPRDFLYRRIIRICPAYWVYATLYFVIVFQVIGFNGPSVLATIKGLLLWPGAGGNIIYAGWTLSYEMYFYVSFAVTLLVPNGLIFVTVFFLTSVASKPILPSFEMATSPLLLEFLVGAWIAKLYKRDLNYPSWLANALIIGSVLGYITALSTGYNRFATVLLGVPSAMLFVGLLLKEEDLPDIVTRLAYLGDSSYSLYLTHMLVLTVILNCVSSFNLSIAERILLWIALYPICVLAGVIGYRLVERPIVQFFKRNRSVPVAA
jgi:exopolysaccharide production protein ExoZ